VQMQPDPRIALSESPYDRWQHVTSLGVGCTDRKRTTSFVAQILGQAPYRLDLMKNALSTLHDLLPCGRNARESAALPGKDLKAQFGFEQPQLLADTGLRSVNLVGRRRDVEVASGHGEQVAQLMKLHFKFALVKYPRTAPRLPVPSPKYAASCRIVYDAHLPANDLANPGPCSSARRPRLTRRRREGRFRG
jgi:hypothetical protein